MQALYDTSSCYDPAQGDKTMPNLAVFTASMLQAAHSSQLSEPSSGLQPFHISTAGQARSNIFEDFLNDPLPLPDYSGLFQTDQLFGSPGLTSGVQELARPVPVSVRARVLQTHKAGVKLCHDSLHDILLHFSLYAGMRAPCDLSTQSQPASQAG